MTDTIKYTALLTDSDGHPDILIYTLDGPATLTRETRMDLVDAFKNERVEEFLCAYSYEADQEDEEEWREELLSNIRVVMIFKGDFNYSDVVHDDRY